MSTENDTRSKRPREDVTRNIKKFILIMSDRKLKLIETCKRWVESGCVRS